MHIAVSDPDIDGPVHIIVAELLEVVKRLELNSKELQDKIHVPFSNDVDELRVLDETREFLTGYPIHRIVSDLLEMVEKLTINDRKLRHKLDAPTSHPVPEPPINDAPCNI